MKKKHKKKAKCTPKEGEKGGKKLGGSGGGKDSVLQLDQIRRMNYSGCKISKKGIENSGAPWKFVRVDVEKDC